MSSNGSGVGIIGVGSYLPEKVLTNHDLEKMVDTSDEWIIKRTGISERRVLGKGEPAYKMGVEAAKKAIADAGITGEDIDLVITATASADYIFPQTACLIQAEIGAKKAGAFDLSAACSGFVYAMTVAQQFIMAGTCKYVLIVGCEALSRITDWEDRNTCVLFGDGAGAAVIGPVEKGYGIIATKLGADGETGRKVLTLPFCYIDETDLSVREHENKTVMYMDGKEVFKFAVATMTQASEEVLENAGMTTEDIDMMFPHQANTRIVDSSLKKLGVSHDKTQPIIQKYGNISSASIPVAIEEAMKAGRLKKGDNIVMVSFGGGLTWASAVLKWAK